MFDSSKCLIKAEKSLSGFYCDESAKKKKKSFQINFRFPEKIQVPYQGRTHRFFQANIQHRRPVWFMSTQSAFSPRPLAARAGDGRAPRRLPRAGHGGRAPASRLLALWALWALWAADRCCCALPSSASTGGPSVAAALSVCVNQRGGSPLPAADFPFV